MSDLVRCLTNGNLEFQYDVLESIINKPELLDVPIVVYSIAGPERTGKSFLLNVFWYLHEKQHTLVDEEVNDQEELPQVFESVFRSSPVTKGIYMTTQPMFMYGDGAVKIAVFLMDTQGINSGDKIECKEGDIFTISLGLSHMQIINVQSKFGYSDFDTYTALTMYAKHVNRVPANKTKLMVLVRDWKYTDEHAHGYAGGNNYYKKLLQEDGRKKQGEYLKIFFESKECFLIPRPGIEIEDSNSKRLNGIAGNAWEKMTELYKNLFSEANIKQAFGVAQNGQNFLEAAKQLKERLSGNETLAPDVSFQSYTGFLIKIETSKCLETYENEIKHHLHLRDNSLEQKHNQILLEVKEALFENSPTILDPKYITNLEDQTEKVIGAMLVEEFVKSWAEKITKKGKFSETEVCKNFAEEGLRFLESFKNIIKNETSQKKFIEKFVLKINNLFKTEIKRRRKNTLILIACVAGFAGLVGGGLFTQIPPLGTLAVQLATAFASACAVTGGSGAISCFITNLVQQKKGIPLPDLLKLSKELDDRDMEIQKRTTGNQHDDNDQLALEEMGREAEKMKETIQQLEEKILEILEGQILLISSTN